MWIEMMQVMESIDYNEKETRILTIMHGKVKAENRGYY